ncbi:polysaccharide biosynthesis/export family protein [Lacihabitans soyangensis]|uniref:Ligand-binding protein n=1 Tax=Lacihabitans soyangensis TaxID=869394 RepID=A0AAE3KUV8_9BACT|nr:SLBB domain-containing protein [Lacihabitans soyangensis]MCP9765354.1 ligand-binding protein [Lacihabitans soyangensis]
MKSPKFRKTNRIAKALVLILIQFAIKNTIFAQTTPALQIPTTVPTTTTPATTKEKSPNNNRTTPVNRTPLNDPTNTREVELAPADQKAIDAEEKQRIEKETELAADLEKSKIIKRTFGSSIFTNSKFDPTATVNVSTPNNYVLGPGDKIVMDIYGYSQFKQTATVNPDGFIVLEKAGVVNVSGLNIEEAERKIKNAFSKIFLGLNGGSGYPANTFLKVSLTGYRMIKVKITGEVVAPGTYTVTSFTSLLNALYASGGPNDIGTYRDIKLVRNNRVVSTLDLYDVITKGFSKGDMLLKDQDIIQVGPYVSRIAMEGNLKRKGLFEVLPNENLSTVINYAGGFDQYAYSERVKVYRNTSKEKRIIDIKNSDFKTSQVYSGDSIVVEKLLERFENLISIQGAIYRPGEYSLDSNPTLLALINSAEGLREESLQGRVNIIRTNEDLSISNITVNLFDIKSGKSADQTLRRMDKVIIPSIFDLTETSYVKIQGAINNPDALTGVQVPYIKEMTIQDLIVKVGGLTEAASLSKIEIVRRKRNVDAKQIDAQISDIIEFEIRSDLNFDSKNESVKLLPYDEVFVRTSPNYEKQNFAITKGEVIYPGIYGIKYKDEKISDLISRAGGLSPQAYIKGATLVRKTLISDFQKTQREEVLNNLNINVKVKTVTENLEEEEPELTEEGEVLNNMITESVGIDLEKILKSPGSVEDLILQDGDEINIPKKLQTIRIEGEVLYPTTVKYHPDLKFIDYVSKSGGFTKKSARGKAFVIYPNGSVDRTRKFVFVKIHPKVEPGSEIIIPGKTENTQAQIAQFGGLVATLSATLTTIVTIFGFLKLNQN